MKYKVGEIWANELRGFSFLVTKITPDSYHKGEFWIEYKVIEGENYSNQSNFITTSTFCSWNFLLKNATEASKLLYGEYDNK